jgi:hypothetical protein
MPQDQTSGAAANAFGRAAAEAIARSIGANLEGRASNRATFREKRVVIKCARRQTGNIGVTFAMQSEISEVVAAFESQDGRYDVFSLPINVFVANQRQSRSGGNGDHQVGQVLRAVFLKHGEFIQSVTIPPRAT